MKVKVSIMKETKKAVEGFIIELASVGIFIVLLFVVNMVAMR